MSDESGPPRPEAPALLFVCWRGSDGTRIASGPLERDHAEALARAYAEFFPEQSYWVEPVPWLEPSPRPRRGNA